MFFSCSMTLDGNEDLPEATVRQVLAQIEEIEPLWANGVTELRQAVVRGNVGALGAMLYGGGIMTVMPAFDIEPIPVMWTTDLVRSRCIAQDLQTVVNMMAAQPNKCAGYFLTFGRSRFFNLLTQSQARVLQYYVGGSIFHRI